jgi:hypothetical protein
MCDEDVARAALRALGIRNPTPDLVENWIRANRAEEEESELSPPTPLPFPRPIQPQPQPKAEDFHPKHRRGYSKSKLEPVLREVGTLVKPHGIRKPGRPRVVATWFSAVVKTMADGTPLKDALKKHGITLDRHQIRALYRNSEFKRLYQEARHRHQDSDLYFKKSLSREERFRRVL